MKKYSGKKPKVVVTSPPYNLSKKYNSYLDNMAYDEYLDWVRMWGGYP